MKKLKISAILIIMCILTGCDSNNKKMEQVTNNIQPTTEVDDKGEVIMMRGRCGEQAHWSYQIETGLLIISGSGELWGDIYPDEYDGLKNNNGTKVDYPYLAYDRDSVKKIIVTEGITKLPMDIFSKYDSLTEVTIGNNVDFVGGWSFCYCRNLKKVSLPDSMDTILSGMFEGCISLEEINIPKNVKTIAGNAFFGCSRLKKIEFQDSVKTIGYRAFYGCSKLSEVIFPRLEGISIASEAFRNTGIKEVILNKYTIYNKSTFDEDVKIQYFE